jgi:uncharacterized protein YlzI (FlbEa/FlbD family)
MGVEEHIPMITNKNVILVVGRPKTGKTESLRNLDPSKVAYANYDKKDHLFSFAMDEKIDNVLDTIPFLDACEAEPQIEYIVLDTLTYMMDMYARQIVNTAKDSRAAWGDYAIFYEEVIQKLQMSKKNIIVLSHIKDIYNEKEFVTEQRVPVQGKIGGRGVEADFSTIVMSTTMPFDYFNGKDGINKIEDLNPSFEEELKGVKHVFMTMATKDSMGAPVRAYKGMWNKKSDLYIDNDVQVVFDRIKEFSQKIKK